MLLMQERPWLRHGAVATVNTKGCGSKQSCLCSLGRCWKWLMCPLAPVWALGGRGGGAQTPRRTKRPPGPAEMVTDPYCVSFGPRQWIFYWFRLQRLALSGWWACMQFVRCFRSWMVWWTGAWYLQLHVLNPEGLILLPAFSALLCQVCHSEQVSFERSFLFNRCKKIYICIYRSLYFVKKKHPFKLNLII